MKINVGIDLGTTYSAVATFCKETGGVRILKNGIGEDCTPSVICMENGRVLIGDDAKQEQKSGNVNTIAFYKSMMGDPLWSAFIDGKEYSAEALSGIFLKQLVQDVSAANHVEIDGAVITVPAYFNDRQREATLRAGRAAGLKVLKIINEPTSAIIAYGLTSGKDKNVMVYDLGGGTFDVTIAHVSGTCIDVLATNGNHQLGGKDWDEVLFNDVQDRFYSEHGITIADFPEDTKELQVKCEEAKKRLSAVSSTLISIQCDGLLGKYTVTRQEFDEKTENLLYETVLLIRSCFEEIAEKTKRPFGWGNIDEVVLVGGSTRMSQVRNMIVREYGKAPITKDINVDTIVATGAAMQAELCVSNSITLAVAGKKPAAAGTSAPDAPMTLTIRNQDIQDITAHSLGMLALASDQKTYINSIIIPKNSRVNEKFGREYTFSGEKLQVYVLQGETRDPYESDIVGAYSVTGVPEKSKLRVDFLYNSNGVVEVNASLADGRALPVTRETTRETVIQLIERLERERREAEEEARRKSRVEIMLMIDVSGSMSGTPIVEARRAAKGFVSEFNLNKVSISIISFADRLQYHCRHENNSLRLERAIQSIDVDGSVGYGNDMCPIGSESKNFTSNGAHVMVVLTDGYWSYQYVEEQNAAKAKQRGIVIYGIGIGDADEDFLSRISSGRGRKVDLSQLMQTFKEVASSIATEVAAGSLK